MRISCPSCSATYEVPDSLVPAGRAVRCARCGGEWAPVPADEVAEPESPPEEPEQPMVAETMAEQFVEHHVPDHKEVLVAEPAMVRLAAHPATLQPPSNLRMAWAASVGVLVLAIGAAYVWRSDIVTAWPPSARAYAVFGLHPQMDKR